MSTLRCGSGAILCRAVRFGLRCGSVRFSYVNPTVMFCVLRSGSVRFSDVNNTVRFGCYFVFYGSVRCGFPISANLR